VRDPTVWVFEPESSALALGSTQPSDDVDVGLATELGIEVIRRHSGGGAVLLEPAGCVWIDVVLPSTDRRWTDDVSVAPLWLGQVWAGAIGRTGRRDVSVHQGPMRSDPRSAVVCFAGLGPGEVLVGGKSVGISQRRTRTAARFQTVALLEWDWSAQQRLLAPGLHRVGAGDDEPSVTPLEGLTIDELVEAFLEEVRRT